MPDSNLPGVDRREFLQAGLAATAAAATLSVGAARAADDVKPGGNKPVLPTRKLGKTGVEVTLLSQGTVVQPTAMDRILRTAYREGVRYFDTAAGYGNGRAEKIIGDWLAAAPEIRRTIFLATKHGVKTPGEMLKKVDERLANLKTDYIDLLFFHGLESDQTDWPKSKEMKEGLPRP